MRPKVVILILVVAFGLLGIMVVLKGLMGGHAGNAGGQTPATQANVDSQSAATNDQVVQVVQVNPNSSNKAATPEQMSAAAVGKELDAIRELQDEADGANNPTIISALIGKVENPEPEVRTAALAALVQLNDTNAVPGLQQAADAMKDPRAKVAVMDTIDYLKLPNVMPDVPPADLDTNIPDTKTMPPHLKMNPKFEHKAGGNGRQSSAPNPAGQPQ